MGKISEIKKRNSIGRKWLIGEKILINRIVRYQDTDYGMVVVMDATTYEKDGAEVTELVFSGAKAVIDFCKSLTTEDLPLAVKLVEKMSANKRTYQDVEDVE